MPGPCKGCGATGYGLSTSGPDYCGACACGVNPELSKLRRAYDKLSADWIDMNFALGIATGAFPPINEHMRLRGQAVLDQRAEEWKQKGHLLQANEMSGSS